MNYKFNLGNVSINMPGEGKVEIKDIGVEVTDFNLKDIPSIIKETRKAFKEVKSLVEEDVKPAVEQFTRPVANEENPFAGLDTDGDLGVDPFMQFLQGLDEANAAHREEEECCGFDSMISSLVEESIKAKHPGAHVIKTANGFAVAIPKNADK